MTTTADTREREQIACDGCGRYERRWKHLCLTLDGAVVIDARLCRRCETYAVDAVKLTISAVIR